MRLKKSWLSMLTEKTGRREIQKWRRFLLTLELTFVFTFVRVQKLGCIVRSLVSIHLFGSVFSFLIGHTIWFDLKSTAPLDLMKHFNKIFHELERTQIFTLMGPTDCWIGPMIKDIQLHYGKISETQKWNDNLLGYQG